MKFLNGETLDQRLMGQQPLSIEEILSISAEAASGLAAARANGLVHRDVKPGNLWIEAPHGRVVLLDFGLARPSDANIELTRSGVAIGTQAYMSPEQAQSEDVDARSDLFSLGAIMYRMCTGRGPFEGRTATSVLMALAVDEPLPVHERNSSIPKPFSDLIQQLRSNRAESRPRCAEEVVKRLRDIRSLSVESHQLAAVPESAGAMRPAVCPASRKWTWKGIVAVCLGLVGLAFLSSVLFWELPTAGSCASRRMTRRSRSLLMAATCSWLARTGNR